jgi:two-component system, OmpR family, sensor histidine kinase KdpD
MFCQIWFLRNPRARYGWAILLLAGATALISVLPITLELGTIQLLFVLVVLVTAVISGFGPAMLAATLSFLSVNFFFVSPQYTLQVARPEDVFRLLEFWIVALLSGALAAYARHQTDRADQRILEMSTLHVLTRAIETESTLQGRLAQIVQTTATILDLPFCALSLLEPASAATWGQKPTTCTWLEIPIVHEETVVGRLHAALPVTRQHLTADEYHVLRLITTQCVQVLERTRLLDAATEARALRESDQLKSAILSSLSHDLRTPLTTIQGAISELNATDVDWSPVTRQQLLDSIDEQAQRLLRMVGNLLDLSKVRAGVVLPHTDWYSLDEVIYHALSGLAATVDCPAITVDIPVALPLIPLDFVLTEHVIMNLVDNAIRYGAAEPAITITATVSAAWLTCSVQNRGLTLPVHWHERVFEPFVRYPTQVPTTGSGLGLAICRGFIEAQGGTMWIDPAWTLGTRVCFTLPQPEPQRMVTDGDFTAHNSDY